MSARPDKSDVRQGVNTLTRPTLRLDKAGTCRSSALDQSWTPHRAPRVADFNRDAEDGERNSDSITLVEAERDAVPIACDIEIHTSNVVVEAHLADADSHRQIAATH